MSSRKMKKTGSTVRKNDAPAVEYTVNELSGWHKVLYWFKALLVVSYIFNVIVFIQDGISGVGFADLTVNVLYLILLSASMIFHERKKGVYLFFAYGILELLYNIAIMMIAAGNGVYEGAVGNRAFEYLFFSAVILIPTAIYYRKRMSEFKL